MYFELWNCNRLWKVWYGLLVTLLQLYVAYNSIRNYIIFKSQYYNPRYGGVWNFGPLNFYIASIITSISLICFFIYFCLISIRNSSLADIRTFLEVENERTNDRLGPIFRIVSKLMREKLPYAPLLHLIMAVTLMLPLPIVQMEQIRNEALPTDSVWMVNFDFFADHFSWLMVDSLPNTNPFKNLHYVMKTNILNVEFINFIIATVIFVIRFPSGLWYSNKWFSIFFSIIIFMNCLTWLIIYEAGSILIKLSGNSLSLIKVEINASITPYWTMLSFIGLHFILTILGFIVVFNYGQIQSTICWLRGFKSYSCFNQKNLRKKYWIFTTIALGFSLLLITLIIDSFVLMGFFNCFQMFNMPIFILAIIFGVVTLILQFLIWFTFSIKNRWNFHLNVQGLVPNKGRKGENGNKYSGSPDTVYGCFHNNITLSTSSSHSSSRGTTRNVEGPCIDSACFGNNYQNYVFLQSPQNQIPTISEDFDENNTNTSKSSSINMNDCRNNISIDQDTLYRNATLISDHGLMKASENLNADSYRSLQMKNGRKTGKLVTFHDMGEGKMPFYGAYEKGFLNSNMDPLTFLKVPDILNLNRPTLSGSLSESSLDQISSSLSSKIAIETNENGMCSDV